MSNFINDYVASEGFCENEFYNLGPFWHLCTPGELQEMLFKSEEDFKFGITSMAISLHEVNSSGRSVYLYAFAVMSNHVHELLSGSYDDCMEYFRIRKMKLKRYFPSDVDLTSFNCQLIQVETVNDFRHEVAYIPHADC